MTRDLSDFVDRYSNAYGFEREVVRYRQMVIIERLREFRPRRILEVGCGIDILAEEAHLAGINWESWTIVEPAQSFADFARNSSAPNVTVVQGLIEDVAADISTGYDYIICASLLQEVNNASSVLEALRKTSDPSSTLHINVPNITSLHRRLARSMGLIENLATVSDRSRMLQQHRMFDLPSLCEFVEQNGFKITATGGHFVKPFTHDQMEKVTACIDRSVLDGLFILGKEMPEIASEIYIEVSLAV